MNDNIHIASAPFGDERERRQYVLSNLDLAIAQKWIKVYYQPIVRAVNERVCDEEALARWVDPERGLLLPEDFVPCLDDAGLAYRLDLYVLDNVLAKVQAAKAAGLHTLPQSINVARSDFDACDMIEEIRRRVDDAGVERSAIAIELSEATVGSDFHRMKALIERFRELGFPVWMDNFGSGFTSIDVLQSIRFDLIKFDQSFIRRFNEGEVGKLILTELMKLVNSLGMDTVCEGIETYRQARFLQTVGCCKLQGCYYMKPLPVEETSRLHRDGQLIAIENPQETAYYEAMGRISLYDLSFMTNAEENIFHNAFDMLPMGIIEFSATCDSVRYIRSNKSFRRFIHRTFDLDVNDREAVYELPKHGPGSGLSRMIQALHHNGGRGFFDEQLVDDQLVHSFAREITVNPVTGASAVAVAVLSVQSIQNDAISRKYAELLRENAYLREEIDVKRKIAELKESISSLLTNMPALTFSKDVATGKYLACNQSFAEYANKETPEDVVGLTDFEIFDPDTAEHFVEDDKKALSMDEPYVFFEDVPDAAGKQKQFQTTKLKFTDTVGRLCLLGMCMDVTEMVRARREAHQDALTGMKNKHAYFDCESEMNRRVAAGEPVEFAVVVFDVNGLKKVNDTYGHQAGDQYIRDACSIIRGVFTGSDLFRTGGDEFVAISQGVDYTQIEERVARIASQNAQNKVTGAIVIACGMARFEKGRDRTVEDVLKRADKIMYQNKRMLKQ